MSYDGIRAAIAKDLVIKTKLAALATISKAGVREWERLQGSPMRASYLQPHLEAAEAVIKELREALPARPE